MISRPLQPYQVCLLVVIILIVELVVSRSTGSAGKQLSGFSRVDIVVVPGALWEAEPELAGAGRAVGSVVTGQIHNDDLDKVIAAITRGTRSDDSQALAVNKLPERSVRINVAAVDPFGLIPQSLLQPPPPDVLRIVAGVDVQRQRRHLRPLVMLGRGLVGGLTSPSTKRAGLVDLTDLIPTASLAAGLQIPLTATGAPVRDIAETSSKSLNSDFFTAQDRTANFYETIATPVILTYVLVQVWLYLMALWIARRRELPGPAVGLALVLASVPLASYGVRLFWPSFHGSIWLWSALLVLSASMISVMAKFAARNPLVSLQRIVLGTVVCIVADLIAGAHLQVGGLFGSPVLLGARYSGLGNPAAALLLSAAVLWSAMHVQQADGDRSAIFGAAGLLLVAGVADGLPGLGSDVGGLVAFVVTGTLTIVSLTKRRVSRRWMEFRWMALAAGAASALVITAATVDYHRPSDSQTHLGRLAGRVMQHGLVPLFDVVSHKVRINLMGYGFPWSLGVIVLAGSVLAVLVFSSRWCHVLPLGSPERVGATMVLVGAFAGYAVNDSGIVVISLVAVYSGPYLMVEHRVRGHSTLATEVHIS